MTADQAADRQPESIEGLPVGARVEIGYWAAIEVSHLAVVLGPMLKACDDCSPEMAAARALVYRIGDLANGAMSALGDEMARPADIHKDLRLVAFDGAQSEQG